MNIRHSLKTAGLVTALLFAVALVGASTTNAIEGESIVLSPASKPYKLNAGETKSDMFTVINDGTVEYDFKVYASPYSVRNGDYDADFDKQTANGDAYRWVKFERTDYRIKPNGRIDVPYTVTVPADATPGGHYGVLFAETQPRDSNASQIMRKKRVGAIMYATVNGSYIEAAKETSVNIPMLQIGGLLHAEMSAENTGNVDTTISKTIRIKNILGAEVYSNTSKHILLPKTTRDFNLEWTNGSNLGWYTVSVESNVLGKKSVHESLVFITPLWFIFVAIAVLGTIAYFAVRHFRR